MLYEVLLVVDLIVAIALIGLVLIQHGKGADMGASFGGGGSNTVFGSTGSGNFLTRTTAILATIFFIVSLALGNLSSKQGGNEDTWENIEVPAVTAPVTEDVPAAGDVPAADQEESESDVPNT
ncbi:preprotein translocase subunit SecG [Planctobacterium marinum]|uniref:Protein-export membrane protein SecG n=1 Tax=Planctobacterium marinum TaxID=1631968 RepID=A0AA48HGM3_9ALTE|nr:preprotein translocase subunit SecG [Planctobacterium marinum]